MQKTKGFARWCIGLLISFIRGEVGGTIFAGGQAELNAESQGLCAYHLTQTASYGTAEYAAYDEGTERRFPFPTKEQKLCN